MSGRVETANRARSSDFPERWGTPPGTPYSEDRAAWIKAQIRKDSTDPDRLQQRAGAARSRARLAEVNGMLALAESHRGDHDA